MLDEKFRSPGESKNKKADQQQKTDRIINFYNHWWKVVLLGISLIV